MSILRSVFSGILKVYNITYVTSTSTGQPLETLVDSGTSIDYSEMKQRFTFSVKVQGNFPIEDFRFLSETNLDVQTNIVEKEGVKYRLKSKLKKSLNNKVFGYEYSCELY